MVATPVTSLKPKTLTAAAPAPAPAARPAVQSAPAAKPATGDSLKLSSAAKPAAAESHEGLVDKVKDKVGDFFKKFLKMSVDEVWAPYEKDEERRKENQAHWEMLHPKH